MARGNPLTDEAGSYREVAKMTNEQKATILAEITTRDEAGRHFMERYDEADIWELEEEGLIEVRRPRHEATGLRYSQEYWSVEVTAEGQDLVGAYPECWPA